MPYFAQMLADWEYARPVIQEQSRYPFSFDRAQLSRLAKGEIVRQRHPVAGTERVIAAVWTPIDRELLWVAIQDEAHFAMVEGIVEQVLPQSTSQSKLLYQHLDLPWPVADRQWVIDIRDNARLSAVSADRVWERAWDLSTQRGMALEDSNAVWAPVNQGGFALVSAAGGSIFVYHVRSSIGGNIPEAAAAQWSARAVGNVLEAVIDRSGKIAGHYTAGHLPVRRPDGTAIPLMRGKK